MVEAPNLPSQLEKGPTGLTFSQNSAVLAHKDGGNASAKAQEGAPHRGSVVCQAVRKVRVAWGVRLGGDGTRKVMWQSASRE